MRFAAFGAFTAMIVSIFSTPLAAQALAPGEASPAFLEWLEGVRKEALGRGIGQDTLDAVIPGIRPLERVVKKDRNQPEVKQTYAGYLKARVSPWRREKGAKMMVEHSVSLAEAGMRYGVQPRYIAAIWGIETNYGTVPLSYSVFDAVATLAYDKRRAERFRRELFAALTILDSGAVSLEDMKGSWAGAMGQPQFMPESYLKYAVDGDGDGHPNIWTSQPDVFASIAHYLKSFGWQNDKIWGRAVMVPAKLEAIAAQSEGAKPARHCASFKSLGAWRTLDEWQVLGARRLSGDDLPTRNIEAALVAGDEGDGQAYLVYSNFCSIMRYNPSFKYALAVGMLSDAIAQ